MPGPIAGLAGSGLTGYFADSLGQPVFWLMEMMWGLPCNAGRWGGTWQSDFDTYFSTRASQGYNAWWGCPWINVSMDPSCLSGGRTWDGIYPLNINGTPGVIATGSETITLNDSFWTRTDYLINSALASGVAVFLNLGQSYDFDANAIWHNLSTTQAQAFGTAVATRYPQASYPNLWWVFGDDCHSGAQDTYFAAMLTGIQSTGDTRFVTMEQLPETNCHVEYDTGAIYVPGGFGITNAAWNFNYSYDPSYLGLEASYVESGTTPIPPVWGDGVWYGDVTANSTDLTERRFVWWALASGSRGIDVTSGPSGAGAGGVWQWGSGALAALTSDPNGTFITGRIQPIVSYFTSLVDWNKLVPDTGNVFVTAGRGTRATSDAPGFSINRGDGDNYVTASITPGGTLAVIYCNTHFSITVNPAKMAAGYGAKWVDPWSLALTTATTGSTYNSTPLGNNSKGDPDWALVLSQPPYATWTVP